MNNLYISCCDPEGGIYRCHLENGKLIFADKTDLDQPMYTVLSEGRLYVLLKETDPKSRFGGVMSFRVAEDGSLCDPSDLLSSRGICPCHLTVADRTVYLVNYLSGNLVGTNGRVSTHAGSGVNLPRQDTAHTHYVNLSPDGKYLLCCDLGLDRIVTYDLDLNEIAFAKVPDGAGARHLAYSEDGRYVYCVNELASTVSVFSYRDGILRLQSSVSALEKPIKNTAAAIRVKDGFVYVSNRGEDTVVCFKADGDRLRFVSRTAVGGVSPRDFNFCGDYLICANEKSDNVTVFAVDHGKLTKTDEMRDIPHPLCVTVTGE